MQQSQVSPLHFEIKKIQAIELNEIYNLKELISQYLAEAKESGISADQIIQRIQDSLPFGVWFIYEGKRVVGFLVASIILDTYKKQKCFVDYLFASKEIRSYQVVKDLCQTGIDWVKSLGVNEIVFVTRRDANAMCKFLPGNWSKDSTVLSCAW